MEYGIKTYYLIMTSYQTRNVTNKPSNQRFLCYLKLCFELNNFYEKSGTLLIFLYLIDP